VWFNKLQWLLELMGIHEVLPSSELLSLVGQVMCNDQAITVDICADVLFIIAGFDSEQLNKVSVKFQCILRILKYSWQTRR
jgi:lysosomal acid lipase/cholesteryl ester hydrolase